MATPNPQRRRQRSVRVTVAVALLIIATFAVILAIPTQSPFWLSLASVVAIVFGWAAMRITWTEVLQSRRDNARDRVAAANAYKNLYSQRAADHAEFTTTMTERLAESHKTQRELEHEVVNHQRTAAESAEKLKRAHQELSESRYRMIELEQQLAVREAEAAEDLAEWIAESEPSVETLTEWEDSQRKTKQVKQSKSGRSNTA